MKEYMIKGFVLDDERLKQGEAVFGKDYFKELLERVRSIRASERRIWQQITDIFAECSIDYDKKSEVTKRFYATVQNKFHYAITGKTAAEIIYNSADSQKENMGLSTWKNSPDGRILKSDVTVAKNYLEEKQIRQLERAVSGYFDYIEDLIKLFLKCLNHKKVEVLLEINKSQQVTNETAENALKYSLLTSQRDNFIPIGITHKTSKIQYFRGFLLL